MAAGHDGELAHVRQALRAGGLRIVTESDPRLEEIGNTPAVKRRLSLCKERVAYYLEICALEEIGEKPDLLQPLHVVERPNRKPRLVLDLSRNLNDLIDIHPFCHQSLDDAVSLSSPGCYYAKMDIADCFLSFDVHPDSRHLLAFELDGRYYRFKRLPFGLSSAPWWCEQFMTVIDFALREAGVSHVRYCDDFLFIGTSATMVRHAMHTARRIFAQHGLACNEDKTEGPLQRMTFLGLGLDSVQQVMFIPVDKVNDIRSCIGRTISQNTTTKFDLQSLVGKLSFVAKAVPGARPFFRSLIDATKGLPHPYAKQRVSDAIRDDLALWQRFLREWNGRSSWRSASPVVIEHDASMSGFGFFLRTLPADFNPALLPRWLQLGSAFAGYYADNHLPLVSRSIQWGELFSIACSVAIYGPYLRSRTLLVKTDNIADVHIINRQRTSAPDLQVLLRAIYRICAEYNIDIHAEHVPGVENVVPDHLSRPALHMRRARVPDIIAPFPLYVHFVDSSSLTMGELPSFQFSS
jgi:hypothetical protein